MRRRYGDQTACTTCGMDVQWCGSPFRRVLIPAGDGRPAVGYVNSDGTAITSWGGAHIARIVRSTTFRSYRHGGRPGDRVLAWSAVLPSGAKCYGRNGGRGMVTNIRPNVARSSRYVMPSGWSITREYGGAPWGRSHVVRHHGTFVSQHETRTDAIARIAAEVGSDA